MADGVGEFEHDDEEKGSSSITEMRGMMGAGFVGC